MGNAQNGLADGVTDDIKRGLYKDFKNELQNGGANSGLHATSVHSGLLSSSDKVKINKLIPFSGPGTTGLVPDPGTATNSFLKSSGAWGQVTSVNSVFSTTAAGLVPAPTIADAANLLNGAGQWVASAGVASGVFTGSAPGLVPASAIGDQAKVLNGAGQWVDPTLLTAAAFTGASSTQAGLAGLVPAPPQATSKAYLRSDGNWFTPNRYYKLTSRESVASPIVANTVSVGTLQYLNVNNLNVPIPVGISVTPDHTTLNIPSGTYRLEFIGAAILDQLSESTASVDIQWEINGHLKGIFAHSRRFVTGSLLNLNVSRYAVDETTLTAATNLVKLRITPTGFPQTEFSKVPVYGIIRVTQLY